MLKKNPYLKKKKKRMSRLPRSLTEESLKHERQRPKDTYRENTETNLAGHRIFRKKKI